MTQYISKAIIVCISYVCWGACVCICGTDYSQIYHCGYVCPCVLGRGMGDVWVHACVWYSMEILIYHMRLVLLKKVLSAFTTTCPWSDLNSINVHVVWKTDGSSSSDSGEPKKVCMWFYWVYDWSIVSNYDDKDKAHARASVNLCAVFSRMNPDLI